MAVGSAAAVAATATVTATAATATGATAAAEAATTVATAAGSAGAATTTATAGAAATAGPGAARSASRGAARGRACLLGGADLGGRGRVGAALELSEREGPVPPRRDQEVLPPGGGDEPFQPVVRRGHVELRLEVQRRLVPAHPGEEVGRRHEDHELQLGLLAPVGNVHAVEAGPVVPHVDRPAVGGPGRPLQGGDVAHPVLGWAARHLGPRADARRTPRRVAG